MSIAKACAEFCEAPLSSVKKDGATLIVVTKAGQRTSNIYLRFAVLVPSRVMAPLPALR